MLFVQGVWDLGSVHIEPSKSARNSATPRTMFFCGAIHIAQQQTSKELIPDANVFAQCEWTLTEHKKWNGSTYSRGTRVVYRDGIYIAWFKIIWFKESGLF